MSYTYGADIMDRLKSIQLFLGVQDDGKLGFSTIAAIEDVLGYKNNPIYFDKKEDEISIINTPSNNYSRKNGIPVIIKPTHVCFHHSCGSTEGTISWCRNPQSGVSYHYVIGIDGSIYCLVDPEHRAWHAGRSSIGGKPGNDVSIGIAFSGDTNHRQLTEDERHAAAILYYYLCSSLKKELDITDHRLICLPKGRKDDLNPQVYLSLVHFIHNYKVKQ